ncbi:tetratricopeptide repeat protein [Flavobacteriales bacterium AH-315-E23]|nr:tetratricopeptide repeat protein [Flavobacteriales bacterium AH-315-E23]
MKIKKDILIIFLIGFGLYANTLKHQYALDDKIVITENEFTKDGFGGIGSIMSTDVFVGFYGTDKNLVAGKRYRPLSLVTFAIEYELFGGDPFVSHLLNVLLYAFTGVLLYIILLKILPDRNDNSVFWTTAFVSTCFYITHPLHTEVVANIKGRDEILTLLGSLGALYYTLKYLDEKKRKTIILASICLFLGLFAKENAITFLFIIPVTVYFFTSHSNKDNFQALKPLLAVSAGYLIIRFSLLGIPDMREATELMNNPFINATTSEKFATISYTFGKYMYLLVWPHPLTHDYYPFQVPIINWADYRAIIPLILTGLIVMWGIKGFWTKKPTFYAFLFYLATFSIVSNVVFPIGSFMNERFMYIPTIGFAIFMGIGVSHGLFKHFKPEQKWRPVFRALTVMVLLAYSYKTVSRNTAWENDFVLSTTDVKISTNSAKINMSAGLSLIDKAQGETNEAIRRDYLIRAVTYLNRSLSLYPTYIQPMLLLGNAYFELGDYSSSLIYFEACLQRTPGYSFAVKNIQYVGELSERNGDIDMALKSWVLLAKYMPDYSVYLKLAELYGRGLGDFNSALSNILVANQMKPNDIEVLNNLGIIYSRLGRFDEAFASFNQVLEQNSNHASTLLNIGITYKMMGRGEKAQGFFDRAVSINPSLKPK